VVTESHRIKTTIVALRRKWSHASTDHQKHMTHSTTLVMLMGNNSTGITSSKALLILSAYTPATGKNILQYENNKKNPRIHVDNLCAHTKFHGKSTFSVSYLQRKKNVS
jgi:hypothetical protein